MALLGGRFEPQRRQPRLERGGILVSRILHQRMLPDRHALDDQDEEP